MVLDTVLDVVIDLVLNVVLDTLFDTVLRTMLDTVFLILVWSQLSVGRAYIFGTSVAPGTRSGESEETSRVATADHCFL